MKRLFGGFLRGDRHRTDLVDRVARLRYQEAMNRYAALGEKGRAYYTAPWRKARICARFVLRPELLNRPRYARIARVLVQDPSVTNRLVAQAVASLKGRNHQRRLAA